MKNKTLFSLYAAIIAGTTTLAFAAPTDAQPKPGEDTYATDIVDRDRSGSETTMQGDENQRAQDRKQRDERRSDHAWKKDKDKSSAKDKDRHQEDTAWNQDDGQESDWNKSDRDRDSEFARARDLDTEADFILPYTDVEDIEQSVNGVSDLIGAAVVDSEGEEFGTIEELAYEGRTLVAAHVSIDGGSTYRVPFEELRLQSFNKDGSDAGVRLTRMAVDELKEVEKGLEEFAFDFKNEYEESWGERFDQADEEAGETGREARVRGRDVARERNEAGRRAANETSDWDDELAQETGEAARETAQWGENVAEETGEAARETAEWGEDVAQETGEEVSEWGQEVSEEAGQFKADLENELSDHDSVVASDLDDIKIKVEEETLTLSGEARSEDIRDAIVAAAEELGEYEVVDEIEVDDRYVYMD